MFNPYPLFIGIRYAGARRRSQLVSFISLVSMMGMALGVALLILVLSVMNGFDREMRNKILGLVPHINITSYQVQDTSVEQQASWKQIENKIMHHPQVQAVAPFVQLNAMLLRGTNVEGVLIYGINPEREKSVSILADYVDNTALDNLQDSTERLSPGILLGAALAKRVGVSVGDTVSVMVPQETDSGRLNPSFVQLTVADIFTTGTELDQSVALISLHRAISLIPPQQRQQGLRVTVTDTFEAPRIAWELSQNIPYGFTTRDWTRTHGNLYSAIQLSKQLVGLMLVTIIAVAAFNVVSALIMIVTDKRGEIAILRTAGASPSGVMAVFMVQGTLIALIGTGIGCILGVLLAISITEIVAALQTLLGVQFLNSDVYPIDYLPSDLRIQDVIAVSATAFVMSVLATVYPAWRASRVQPADALRYE
ncbi:lipoprotein-releasing ABC transporter permease subunit [Oceanicoccus sp. KOV_DT_Chl]|uniref:lipoprotein-releasing ABC transporter permease subunit n=1 Tax=Oceanicoccus sp. KOV_DT_Chl TaxID=1904639 RepID=UPI000C7C0BB7|nr:lipoprotein-releasing ABC transporter permease subunit [Oceanicoccus sp. KOV_DT_Chl]